MSITIIQFAALIAPWVATFPHLSMHWAKHSSLVHTTAKTLLNIPLLWTILGPSCMRWILLFWVVLQQVPKYALGCREGVELRIEVEKSWLPFKHAALVHTKRKESIEYGWYGPRNLIAPFQGRLWRKEITFSKRTLRIPVAVDFSALQRVCAYDVGRYGPFFNCQVVWITKLGTNFPALAILLLLAAYSTAWVFFPWALVWFSSCLGLKIAGKSPLDLIILGRQEDGHIPALLAADFADCDLEAGTTDPPGDPEDLASSVAEFTMGELLSLEPEHQALAVIQYVEDEADQYTTSAMMEEEAVQTLKALWDVTEEEAQREYFKPVPNDTLEQWLTDFVAWGLQEIKSNSSSVPLLRDLVRFCLALKDTTCRALGPVVTALRAIAFAVYQTTLQGVEHFLLLCSRLVDLAFGRQVTRKLKAAWFGAELLKQNKMSISAQIRDTMATAHFYMEQDFDSQYAKDTRDLRQAYDLQDVDWDKLQQLQDPSELSRLRFKHRGPRGIGGPAWKPLPLPRSLVVSQQELDLLMAEADKEGVDFNAKVDNFFTKRVERLMAGGTPLATDGALITAIRPRQLEASLLRYTYHGIEPNQALKTNVDPFPPELKARLDAVAEAQYEACPEVFNDPKLTPPEAMLEWWKHRGMTKFNTTAPLNMASRAHAIADGQIAAFLRDVHTKRLAGVYPNQYYGAKAKQQAVDAFKLVTPDAEGNLKPPRTFVAQDSRSTAMDWTVGLELKNRLPPDHAGVSSKMAAGQGYSPLFRSIRGRENIFMGDMGRYDSQLEREHFYMLDRMLELGVKDEVVRSWLTVKHEAMQNSYIAILSAPRGTQLSPLLQHARASRPGHPTAAPGYENWILKIRSGATGESSTNWTDTWTFRPTMCLIVWDYCDYFNLPFHPRDFFNDNLAKLINSGDDNMGHLSFLKERYGHAIVPEVMVSMARKRNMILDFAVLGSDQVEFLGCMAREPTDMDLRTLDRVKALFREANVDPKLVRYRNLNPDLVDPITGDAPDIIVYRNLTNSLVRQTATVIHGNNFRNDEYLQRWLAKYVGHLQLCAFRPTFHQDTMMEYIQTAIRWIYSARPDATRNQQGIVQMPTGEAYDKIMSLMNLQHEDVGKRLVYARPLSKAPSDPWFNTEMRRRILWVSQRPPTRYAQVIALHMAHGKKPASYYDRKMNKILSGLYPIDESAKEFLDLVRGTLSEVSKKVIKGFHPQARDQMYLEDIYDSGHYYVEAAIWLTWEDATRLKITEADPNDETEPDMTLPIWQGLCSKAAFGSITDPLRFYALMQDKEFQESIRAEHAYVYRNAMWALVFTYVAFWRLEVAIYGVPVLGFLYALFMFSVIDMSKVYGVLSMLYWLEYMDVHPVISSWMPRDPYILAKRVASWTLKLWPMWVLRLAPFSLASGWVADGCVWFAQFYNRAQSVKPLAGHGRPIDNPWTGDAHRMVHLLADPEKTPDNAIILSSPTGTGKSALGTDALQRLIQHQVDGRSRMWVFVPTKILLKDPMPGFLQRGIDSDPEHEKTYQVLRRGIPIRANAEILFMTYGHGRNRLLAGEFRRGIDTAFVDEMHILSAEQRLVVEELRGERMIFSSATHVPPPGFTAPVFRSTQKKRWKCHEVVFPASTNVASMVQRALNDESPIMGMKSSPAQLANRTLALVGTFKEVDEFKESMVTLRKSIFGAGIGVNMPPVVELSSRVKPGTAEWNEREAAFQSGRYIAIGTKQAATGLDIKPFPPTFGALSGTDVYSHEGSLLVLPTTARDHEQQLGRFTRNSATEDGLVYVREQAGTRTFDTLDYPSVSYLSEPLISNAYGLPLLLPMPIDVQPAVKAWPHFAIRDDVQTHVRAALIFTVLAAASGVSPRDLPKFYIRHHQNGWPLPEEYEWMETLIARGGVKTVMSPPPWVTLEQLLNQQPVLWNTSRIRGGLNADHGLTFGNLLYPVAGEYLGYELMQHHRHRQLQVETRQTTAEWAQADLLLKLQSQVHDLTNGKLKPEADPLLAARIQVTKAVRAALSGATNYRHRGLVSDLIARFCTRERSPQAPYTGPDLFDPAHPDVGWGYCDQDGCAAAIGESGPCETTQQLPCGHFAQAPGDHVIANTFVVVKRGVNWTARYSTAPTVSSQAKHQQDGMTALINALITEEDLRAVERVQRAAHRRKF